MTWFQAVAVCRNADKRLLTNVEWQAAAFGTSDPGATPESQDCNTNSAGTSPTGSRANCISDTEIFDMVGNVWKWVGDWVQGNADPWNPSNNPTDKTNGLYGDDLAVGINPARLAAASQ